MVIRHHSAGCMTPVHGRYNDLPGPDAATVPADRRPILGGTGPDKLPYPCRLRTGRPLNDLGDEPLPKGMCSGVVRSSIEKVAWPTLCLS